MVELAARRVRKLPEVIRQICKSKTLLRVLLALPVMS